MRHYKYKAISREGTLHKGVVTVASMNELMVILRKRGLSLISVSRDFSSFYQKKMKSRDLMDLALHFEQAEKAGIPLKESLEDLKAHHQSPKVKRSLGQVIEDVEGGLLFSDALAKQTPLFDPLFSSLCHVGEKTGHLSTAFHHLFQVYKRRDELEAQTFKALRYPLIMTFVLISVVILLMGVFVPELISFLKPLSGDLPFSTRLLMNISSFISMNLSLITLGGLIGFGGSALFFNFTQKGAVVKDWLLRKIPLFGDLRQKIMLSHFCHHMAIMVENDIDVLEAIQSARDAIQPGFLHRKLKQIDRHVTEGTPLSIAFEKTGLFPPLVVRIMRCGENTSSLKESLHYVRDHFDTTLKRQIDHVVGVMEPMMIVAMGLFIAWIVMSVFLPLYDTLSQIDY